MLNRCDFIGNLGASVDTRYTQAGDAVANFSIACTETWKKDGQKQERTEWVKIVAFGKLAEICSEYLDKGSRVYISGRMQTRSYEDKDNQKRWSTEIIAREMLMMGGPSTADRQDSHDQSPPLPNGDKPF